MSENSQELLFLNGEFMPLSQGRVSIEDRGFQFGDGIYEVIRVLHGRLFRLQAHLERLRASAAGIKLNLEYDGARVAEICEELPRRSKVDEGFVYIQVTRGAAPRNHLPGERQRPTTLAYAREKKEPSAESRARGVTAASKVDDRWEHCDLKTIALLASVMGAIEARERGVDEMIYHRPGQAVYESTSANVFAVIDGVIYTHPAGPKILNGITRMALLEICRDIGVPCREEPRPLEDFLAAQEVFVTSTTRYLHSVVSIDGKPIGDGRPGPVCQRLLEAFRQTLERETRA